MSHIIQDSLLDFSKERTLSSGQYKTIKTGGDKVTQFSWL